MVDSGLRFGITYRAVSRTHRRIKEMEPKKFKDPKRVEINGEKFIISKIPAVQAQQVYGAIMKECKDDGDIAMTYLSLETTLQLLAFAACDATGSDDKEGWMSFNSENEINSYCRNIDTLIELEAEMIRYNFGFLSNGTLQKVLGVLRGEGI